MYDEVLHPEKKLYWLRNPPTIKYDDGRDNWVSVDWNNIIVGSNDLHSVTKAYVNDVNDISTFVELTTPTNIITNETILTHYSFKQVIKKIG